ncbi:MAG TPA: carbohydrate ABC transporter permease [Streptosporangiaceae bacterium]|nr:carbohydrate ABC transporter permease [Streptosporangiaceae bacterium]
MATGLLVVILFLAPVLYVVMIAFQSQQHFLVSPNTPGHVVAGNFGAAWNQADLGPELLNTVLYSVVAAALSTLLGLLIAFPIARRLVRGASGYYLALMVGLFLPFSVIALYAEARSLGLYDSRIGYIILHVEPGMPLAVLLLVAFITAIPAELDEAAWMEGAGYLAYLVRVVLPLTRPALVIAFLYGMVGVWNDIIGPVVFLADSSLFPVTRGIFVFYGSNTSAWPKLAAAIVIVSLPVVILFAASQRQLIRARFMGSVKG